MTVMTSDATLLYPARKGPRPMTAEDLWAIPRVGAPAPAPDGSCCVVAVTTYDLEKNEGRGRLWLVPARGGEPRPLTAPESGASEPALSPDGRRLAFVRKLDQAKPQLYLMPLDGGEPRRLTDLPLGVFDPKWLPDGSGLVFASMLLKGHLTPEATAASSRSRIGRDQYSGCPAMTIIRRPFASSGWSSRSMSAMYSTSRPARSIQRMNWSSQRRR